MVSMCFILSISLIVNAYVIHHVLDKHYKHLGQNFTSLYINRRLLKNESMCKELVRIQKLEHEEKENIKEKALKGGVL